MPTPRLHSFRMIIIIKHLKKKIKLRTNGLTANNLIYMSSNFRRG